MGSRARNAQPDKSGSSSCFSLSIILTDVESVEEYVTKKSEAFDDKGRAACCAQRVVKKNVMGSHSLLLL